MSTPEMPPRPPEDPTRRTAPGAAAWPPPPTSGAVVTPSPRPARGRWAVALAAGLLAGTVGGAVAGRTVADDASPTSPPPATALAQRTPLTTSSGAIDVAGVVAAVQPSVVSIQTRSVGTDAFRRPVTQRGAGSGFIASADGIVYTNAHVVAGATQVEVTLADGRNLPGRVLGSDAANDLAAVKVDATDLPVLPMGDASALRVGDPVVAIGNALALEGGPSATQGIVSALDRAIDTDTGIHLSHLVQTDAAINPGNSGGPLVNAAGEVIGINTAAAGGAENVGFAISIDHARSVLEGLEQGRVPARAFLGVQTVAADDGRGNGGAAVVLVVPGSAAAAAGLQVDDVIIAVGERPVEGPEDLGQALAEARPGDVVDVRVQRGTQELTLPATLGERAED